MAIYKPTITIDGTEIPRPDNGWVQTIADLSTDESGTMLTGTSYKDVVGKQASIPFKYSKLEWEKAAEIALLVDGKAEVEVTYPDIRHPYQTITRKMYSGNRSCEIVENDTDGQVYWKLEFDLITMEGNG